MTFNRFTWLAALTLVCLGAMGWWLRQHRVSPLPRDPTTTAAPRPDQPGPPRRPPSPAAASDHGTANLAGSVPDSGTNFLQRLLAESNEMSEAVRAQIAPWLVANRTNAESLLAVQQAGGGQAYLLAALTNFPNDPRVLFGALTLDDSAEAKRARLDRFQAVAPDNSLADYLSARDHLQHARPEEAIRDLTAAAQKSHFQDYLTDAVQNCEEFYLAAGKSPLEARALACSTALLPLLAQLKALAVDLATL